MSNPIVVSDVAPGWLDVIAVARQGRELTLDEGRWARIERARQVVEQMADASTPYYGINTGLGALCDVVLDRQQLSDLSRNTLMSHACGVGAPLRVEQVRAIMCCAVINWSHGHSGISPGIVQGLLAFLNMGITPVVPGRGSVGYLTHMAHIGLALLGVGEVDHAGERRPASDVLAQHALTPVVLGPKDGLSLVNGTAAMTGLACIALDDAHVLADWADAIGAASFEALSGQQAAFTPEVLALKGQPGVVRSGANLRRLLADSQHLQQCQGHHLQDALSLRAMPQVHGSCREQLEHAIRLVDGEISAATDNPLVIDEGTHARIVSQANPHGAPVALACDSLAMAVCEWASISERRSYRLVTPQASELPAFLTRDSGVKSGLMIAQYTTASLAAEVKRLALPASVDNYLTSGLQEDHLSFGDSAALKLDQALEGALRVLSIELLLAVQALDLIPNTGFGLGAELTRRLVRERIDHYDESRPLHQDMEQALSLLKSATAIAEVRRLLDA
ncbi:MULTISPECIES: HAL/PAL/TAL family ammonia-lyase [Halomonas]|uniref:HAL/PAL/TAL family ammonia-lyase n=1 Tax=Halomonas TaxID=2745 RepID=UPI001C939438|nr:MULTISPECIES: histidine ammonia-lyase [Halomonas]MBY6209019.1 histidine ammonia-lyase [Halomonas sp. DP3Y7-2]MBY6227489.1 histidine ammonia-lyase [Halomonas sp. DP3Y7-1]MCA0914760.1 histidine ammonia-lyase [Halomonas denitrificans]